MSYENQLFFLHSFYRVYLILIKIKTITVFEPKENIL